jgi:CubicO group peptidase (beta-lactamase class C family)
MRMLLAALVAAPLLGGCQPLRVASAFTAHQLCAQAFVAEQPAAALMEAYVRPMIGVPVLRDALRHEVDTAAREVRASVAGRFTSRAVYTEGRGCTVLNGGAPPAPVDRSALDTRAAPALSLALDPRLGPALDRAFTPDRRAIVVVREGRIVAERYAPGHGPETRLQSWSMAKSVTHALLGMLVRDGRLDPAAQVPGLPPGVTADHLLRHTSGHGFGQSNTGFDRSTRMQFLEADGAAFAASGFDHPPGARWSYSDANTALLSRLLRDAVGGTPDAVARFADTELFGPLGMAGAVLEFDQAGTPMGANWVHATARDWARFGRLYAEGGMAGGRRILSASWVAQAAAPTPLAPLGYGAGFWTNLGDTAAAARRRAWGMPEGSFFAMGNSGQVILVAPAERLVIVSLGFSLDASNRETVQGVAALAAAVMARGAAAGSAGHAPRGPAAQ